MGKRAIVIVCDSLGVGEAPDAAEFGDAGSNTLGHVLRDGKPEIPNLRRLGLLHTLEERPPESPDAVAFGRMAELSAGKDTITGHWEMMGLVTEIPFRTYPEGFPSEVIAELERRIGRRTLANRPASGTVIIDELGEEHMRTGSPIVYTSGDSVFQIAAHEDVIPVETLWEICEEARELMQGDHLVGRIIARPFIGSGPGAFTRTANRRDYSVSPSGETYLDRIQATGKSVAGIGKIHDIFDGVGVDADIRSQSNSHGMEITRELLSGDYDLVFTNLVDFDSKYGHRNDPIGYARSLESFDGELAALADSLDSDTLLFITADHGCDPSDESTDHTREFVPSIVISPRIKAPVDLGELTTFADLGATVAHYLGADTEGLPGQSFLDKLKIND